MNQTLQYQGIFTAADLPADADERMIRRLLRDGVPLSELGLPNTQEIRNIIMDAYKLAAVTAVYGQIDRLAITSQTSTPSSSETSYSGALYTTAVADEYYRSGLTNPYRVGWQIRDASANGTWGSMILITSTGSMINRALAGVTKTAGVVKIVDFQGSVT